jgi:hypothetical protein
MGSGKTPSKALPTPAKSSQLPLKPLKGNFGMCLLTFGKDFVIRGKAQAGMVGIQTTQLSCAQILVFG